MITNRLKINDKKTEFLFVGSYQQLSKVQFQLLSGFWNQAYFQRLQSQGMVLEESPHEHSCEQSLQ